MKKPKRELVRNQTFKRQITAFHYPIDDEDAPWYWGYFCCKHKKKDEEDECECGADGHVELKPYDKIMYKFSLCKAFRIFKPCCQTLVNSPIFENIIMVFIVCNSITLGTEHYE